MNPYASIEESVANEYGLNPTIFENLANVESSQNPDAISSAGAQGLYQIMPFNDALTGLTNPFDPAQNARAGAHI
jgi:soluble lytic murein transglycosylase-like protein